MRKSILATAIVTSPIAYLVGDYTGPANQYHPAIFRTTPPTANRTRLFTRISHAAITAGFAPSDKSRAMWKAKRLFRVWLPQLNHQARDFDRIGFIWRPRIAFTAQQGKQWGNVTTFAGRRLVCGTYNGSPRPGRTYLPGSFCNWNRARNYPLPCAKLRRRRFESRGSFTINKLGTFSQTLLW